MLLSNYDLMEFKFNNLRFSDFRIFQYQLFLMIDIIKSQHNFVE